MKSSCQCKTSTICRALVPSTPLSLTIACHGTAKHPRCNQACYPDPRRQISESRSPVNCRDNCKHLSIDQQKKFLQLLKKYESLFDGTLGDWKTKPVSFQLKEGVSPYHGRAFPVPKNPQRHHHKRDGEIVQTGGIREAACI